MDVSQVTSQLQCRWMILCRTTERDQNATSVLYLTCSTMSGSGAAGQPAVMTQPGRQSLALHTSSAQCGATGATRSTETCS